MFAVYQVIEMKYYKKNLRKTVNYGCLESTTAKLTKVEVMPAHAPAASLPTTESSSFSPLNNFCKSETPYKITSGENSSA